MLGRGSRAWKGGKQGAGLVYRVDGQLGLWSAQGTFRRKGRAFLVVSVDYRVRNSPLVLFAQ